MTRTGEPEDVQQGGAEAPQEAPAKCGDCGDALLPGESFCYRCGAGADPPEPADPLISTCHYCGGAFEGPGDDCGSCRLTGEDLVRYGRDRAAQEFRR